MPVARIYTRVPEASTELVERLRARGYTIELVDPGDFRVTPADLEIRLDRMKTEEAFAAAAEFGREQRSKQNGVEIFVAEGVAVDEAALRAAQSGAVQRGNIVLDGLKGLIAPFRRAGREVHMSRAARRQQAMEREAAAEARATERAERERQEAAARVEAARLREEEARRALEREVEREAAIAREREEDARRQEEEARKRAERAAVLAREREEETRRQNESREHERLEAARQMEAEAEQRRQHAEAAARLAAVAEQEAERARQENERAEREVVAQLVAQERPAAPAATSTERPPRPRVAPERYAPREREGSRVVKRAFVAAACIAILAAVGWGAYENRTPAAPLSNSDRVRGGAIHQDVPFGGARINASGQQQARPVAQPAAKPAQSPLAAQPAGSKPGTSKPTASTPKRARNNGADTVAEDQVIYHGAPKRSTSRAAAQQRTQVKKISDMD